MTAEGRCGACKIERTLPGGVHFAVVGIFYARVDQDNQSPHPLRGS
jgi:hypothetical protein